MLNLRHSQNTYKTCQPDPRESYTAPYQKHTPSSFCYYIKSFDDDVYSKETVIVTKGKEDDNIVQIFVDMLEADIKDIYTKFKEKKTMVFNKDDKRNFKEAMVCHICKKPFEAGEEKVRDHCHLTGKFRGAAHNRCNLNYKDPKFSPVIFHNLSGYDSYLFIKQLEKTKGDIDCIADNEEKYISFSKEVVLDKYTDEKGVEKDVIES